MGRMAVKMAVADAYVGVLRARQVAAVAHQSLENMLAHERDVAQMFEHEVVPQTDLLAAQVARSQARYPFDTVSSKFKIMLAIVV